MTIININIITKKHRRKQLCLCLVSYFAKISGSIAAVTPRRMLNATYKTATPIEPFLMSCAVSSEKVENVVKPPQIPTFKNKISLWSRFAYFETARAIQPIASAPTTFTINVASGKPSGFFSGSSPTRYLKTAPTKPPKPTKRQFSISFTAEIKAPF